MKSSVMCSSRPARWLLALCLSLVLAACAGVGGRKMVNHAFNFDGRKDGWSEQVNLLAFSYGDQYQRVRNSVDAPRSSVFLGMSALPVQEGVNGPMPLGDFLYVKWQLKATREVLEERVDLRDRLPSNMTDHELTFVIDGRQLYVYVVTPQRQTTNLKQKPHKTWLSTYNIAYEIFPHVASSPGVK